MGLTIPGLEQSTPISSHQPPHHAHYPVLPAPVSNLSTFSALEC